MAEEEEIQTSVFEDIEKADSIETAVAYTIGAASVCWSEAPTGIFDSERAMVLANALRARIRKEYANG